MISLAVGFALFIVLFFAVKNRRRARLPAKMTLIPNILLTRYPLVFVPGEQSLFYFGNYWNHAPRFLAEHGFEVYELHLPWRGARRTKALKKWLESQNQKQASYHIFCDPLTQEFLRSECQSDSTAIRSLQTPKIDKHSPTFKQKDLMPLLTQTCFLAERDFQLDS